MDSNCALRILYSDSLLQEVEINLGRGVRFLAISLSDKKSENNCIVKFVRRLLLSIREGLLFRLRGCAIRVCTIVLQSDFRFLFRKCVFTKNLLQQSNIKTEKGWLLCA